jgi:hypothetical protein
VAHRREFECEGPLHQACDRAVTPTRYKLTDLGRTVLDELMAGGEVMTEGGARYAITVDGVGRTRRDSREAAFEAANVLKALRPYTKIVISDLGTGAEIDPQKP